MKTKKQKKEKKKKHKKEKKASKKQKYESSDSESSSGEMVWVEASIDSQSKSAKAKKHHKEEKHKRKKKKRTESTDDSSSSSESEDNETSSSSRPTTEREEWMNDDSFVSHTFSSRDLERRPGRKQKSYEAELIANKILAERELNPNYKKSNEKPSEVKPSTQPVSQSVGDGGYGWLRKAYLRVKQQAQEEGRSMEEVAVERWGSLERLQSMLKNAESRMLANCDKGNHNQVSDSYKRQRFMAPKDDDDQSASTSHDSNYRTSSRDLGVSDSKANRSKSPTRQYDNKYSRYQYDKHNSLQRNKESYRGDSYTKETARRSWQKKDASSKDTELTSRFHRPNDDIPESKVNTIELQNKARNTSADDIKKLEGASAKNKDSSDESDEDSRAKSNRHIVLNHNELNLLAAKALRAEMWEDFELATKIQKDLGEAKALRRSYEESGGTVLDGEPRDEILSTEIDCYPLPKALKVYQKKEKYMKKNVVCVGPLKTKYFDDKLSLQSMFEVEKRTTGTDNLKMYMDAASSFRNFVNEDHDDYDDVSGKLMKKMSKGQKEEKDILKAIQNHKRLSAALEKCKFCLDKPILKTHTIIGKGEEVFLCAPPYKSLVEGHCFIIPVSHVSSSLYLDENEWLEIKAFKKGLIKMFGDKQKDVIFMESSVYHHYFPHAFIECIPMPKEIAELAPLYFKKAIEESETEWAHNKKLIDLSKKDVRHAVPKELPFFCVEFGLRGGFAHIIEDEKSFPRFFGKEVVGGMLEIDSYNIIKAKEDSTQDICKKVLKMVDDWWKYKDYFKY